MDLILHHKLLFCAGVLSSLVLVLALIFRMISREHFCNHDADWVCKLNGCPNAKRGDK